MYLQITTRCNMSCAHCCFSCTKEGDDMPLSVFRKAIEFDCYITLGGGEPTLHRHFNTMLLESLASKDHGEGGLTVITNGSVTRTALLLAALAKSNVLDAQISRDEYHDPIDPRVVRAFEKIGEKTRSVTHLQHHPGIRNTTQQDDPKPYGRGIELLGLEPDDLEHDGSDCMCSDHIVKPNGNIMQCGCPDAPMIGDVENGIGDSCSGGGECCHSSEFHNWCIENDHEHWLV